MANINKFDVQVTPEESEDLFNNLDSEFVQEMMSDINRQYEEMMDDMAEAIKKEEAIA